MSFEKASSIFDIFTELDDITMFTQQNRFYKTWKIINMIHKTKIIEELKTYRGFIEIINRIHMQNIRRKKYSSNLMLSEMTIKILPRMNETCKFSASNMELYLSTWDYSYSQIQDTSGTDNIILLHNDEEEEKRENARRLRREKRAMQKKIPLPSLGTPIKIKMNTPDAELDKSQEKTRECLPQLYVDNTSRDKLAQFLKAPRCPFIPATLPADMTSTIADIDENLSTFMSKTTSHVYVSSSHFLMGYQDGDDGKVKQTVESGYEPGMNKYLSDRLYNFYGTTDGNCLYQYFKILGNAKMFQESYSKFMEIKKREDSERRERNLKEARENMEEYEAAKKAAAKLNADKIKNT